MIADALKLLPGAALRLATTRKKRLADIQPGVSIWSAQFRQAQDSRSAWPWLRSRTTCRRAPDAFRTRQPVPPRACCSDPFDRPARPTAPSVPAKLAGTSKAASRPSADRNRFFQAGVLRRIAADHDRRCVPTVRRCRPSPSRAKSQALRRRLALEERRELSRTKSFGQQTAGEHFVTTARPDPAPGPGRSAACDRVILKKSPEKSCRSLAIDQAASFRHRGSQSQCRKRTQQPIAESLRRGPRVPGRGRFCVSGF